MELESFRFGRCYAMAYGLSELSGWNISALIAKREGVGVDHVVHAFIEKDGVLFDALGQVTKEELFKIFLDGHEKAIPTAYWTTFQTQEEYKEALKVAFNSYDDSFFDNWYEKDFKNEIMEAKKAILEFDLIKKAEEAWKKNKVNKKSCTR